MLAVAVVQPRAPISFARDVASLDLEELLGEARDSYQAELQIPMTVDQPPALRERDGHGEWVTQAARGAEIGLSMSPELYQRIGPPASWGNRFPVGRSIDDLRGWCHGTHLKARGGPWENHFADVAAGAGLRERLNRYRPLCARLAYYTVVWRVPPGRVADHEGLDRPDAFNLLRQALRHAWQRRLEWAHADTSGVGEVLAEQRRQRREARARAEASRAEGVTCRYCNHPYDATSTTPCSGLALEYDGQVVDATLYRELGFELLCSPA